MCIWDIPRALTPCAEVATPPIGVERDALTLCVVHARLLARREVGFVARRLAQPVLTLGHITLLAVKVVLLGGGSCKNFQPHRMCNVDSLRFLTTCAEVTAPPVLVVRDALAHRFILALLLACRDVGGFARRLAQVDLALAHVAFLLVNRSAPLRSIND